MRQKIMNIGNSLGVTVPVDFVKSVGIRAGDMVEVIKKPEQGKVIYQFSGIKQLALEDNFLKKRKNG